MTITQLRICLTAANRLDHDTYMRSFPAVDPEELADVWSIHDSLTVRTVRDMTGLSQAAFAAAYGIPRRNVENWESTGVTHHDISDYLLHLLATDVITSRHCTAQEPDAG